MVTQENSSGKPLADPNWLSIHHNAKLKERTNFSKKLANLNPKTVVDLGCASGLWLELLNNFLPDDCSFVGVDSDDELLAMASNRATLWKRKTSFIKLDLENQAHEIPAGDLTLAFNIFSYIKNIDSFINTLSNRTPKGILAIRQYDGDTIRFGPFPTAKRQEIESDLRIALENSNKFYHYDLDRTFNVIKNSSYQNCRKNFELFERSSPFSNDVLMYYKETILWISQFLSEKNKEFLLQWINEDLYMNNHYICEVDLIAILS